jgi:hypothetical protein
MAGNHEVMVKSACHYPEGQTLNVERGETRKLTLKPKLMPAAIEVAATNKDGDDVEADVHVDVQKLGKTFQTLTVSVCAKKLRVVGADGEHEQTLALKEKQTAAISVVLKEKVEAREEKVETHEEKVRACWIRSCIAFGWDEPDRADKWCRRLRGGWGQLPKEQQWLKKCRSDPTQTYK